MYAYIYTIGDWGTITQSILIAANLCCVLLRALQLLRQQNQSGIHRGLVCKVRKRARVRLQRWAIPR